MKKIIVAVVLAAGLVGFGGVTRSAGLAEAVSGKILLQVEAHGEAWYVYPETLERHYLGRPSDAFDIMRSLGLGVAHNELAGYLSGGFPSRLSGLIMLDVEAHGEAYYVYPDDLKGYYLGRPSDAFDVMRNLGLGITDSDLSKIVDADSSGLPYAVVDTHQTACYGDSSQMNCPSAGEPHYGQDANYLGNAPSYRDNNDGTVTDLVTGLMWVKANGDKSSYYEAVGAADSFSLAGYDDWRTPTIKELYSLMDFRGIDPTDMNADPSTLTPFIDDSVFDYEYGDTSDGSRVIDSQWVTSNINVSKVMNNQECFFGVNFADGRIKCYPTADNGHNAGYFVRYVRGGNGYGTNAFSAGGDGTVTDAATGLVWQQGDNGTGVSWSEALSYCELLSLGGHDDWRLPNIKELQSIADYSRSPGTSSSPALDPIFSATEITNEAGERDWGYYWSGTTHVSQNNSEAAAYVSFGRALGYMAEFGGWIDVHGAGAQRSDSKVGSPSDYPTGFGPQGDARRSQNFARCVRGGAVPATETDEVSASSGGSSGTPPSGAPTPPAEAISACTGKPSGLACSFQTAQGAVSGTCRTVGSGDFACAP